jgi:hypothetical protein
MAIHAAASALPQTPVPPAAGLFKQPDQAKGLSNTPAAAPLAQTIQLCCSANMAAIQGAPRHSCIHETSQRPVNGRAEELTRVNLSRKALWRLQVDGQTAQLHICHKPRLHKQHLEAPALLIIDVHLGNNQQRAARDGLEAAMQQLSMWKPVTWATSIQ